MLSRVAGRLRRQDSSAFIESHGSPSSAPPSPTTLSQFAPPPAVDGFQVPSSALQIAVEPHPGLDDLPIYLGQEQDTRTEHTFELNSKSSRWLTLRVRSHAGPAQLFPMLHHGATIEGEIEMVLTSPLSVHSVVVEFEGLHRSLGVQDKYFLILRTSLWPTEDTAGSHKMTAGTYLWPFVFTLPHTVTMSWENEKITTATPPSYCLKGVMMSGHHTETPSVEYSLRAIVNCGTFRQDHVLTTMVTVLPRSRPKPSSLLRQAAYASRMPPAGPEDDSQGWSPCSGTISGTLFSKVAVQMGCTLHLATPLCYARGTFIPFTITFASRNTQALDLFALPSSVNIHLEQRVVCGAPPKAARSSDPYTKVMTIAEGRCVSSRESAPEWRRLEGELRTPRNAKPSFFFVRFALTYNVVLTVDCIGFVPSSKGEHALVLEQEVAIATDRPRGPRQPPSMFPDDDGLRLFYADGSPFASKIILAIHELGLSETIDLQALPEPLPRDLIDSSDLYPLSSFVPTLVTPQGTIFDSSVILQYLDSLSSDAESKIYPPPNQRWQALTYEALCKGVMGTAMMIQRQLELANQTKSGKSTNTPALGPQEENVRRGLARLARYPLPDAGSASLGVEGIALATLLWYLSRWPWSFGWRTWEACEDLGRWFESVKLRTHRVLDFHSTR